MDKSGSKHVFAINLQKYIDRSGRSRRDVCDDLGFRYSTFSDWLNCNAYPRIDKIEKLAAYFGIQKSDLIERHTSSSSWDAGHVDSQVLKSAQWLVNHPTLFKSLEKAEGQLSEEDIDALALIIIKMCK